MSEHQITLRVNEQNSANVWVFEYTKDGCVFPKHLEQQAETHHTSVDEIPNVIIDFIEDEFGLTVTEK